MVSAPSGLPEVGRAAAVDARDALYNDPVSWLRGLVRRARGA